MRPVCRIRSNPRGWLFLALLVMASGQVQAADPLPAAPAAPREYSAWRKLDPLPARQDLPRSTIQVRRPVQTAAHAEPIEPAPELSSRSPSSRPEDSARATPLAARTAIAKSGSGLKLAPPGQKLRPSGSTPPSSNTAKAVTTVISSLAVVLGAFLLLVWLTRRAMPKGSQRLPDDVVQFLGRRQLEGRQHLQLVRFGNKLVLMHVSATGAEPVSEITDPDEVHRLSGICTQHLPDSISATFRDVLQQLGDEKSSRRHVNAAASGYGPYQAQRRGRAGEVDDG